MTKWNVLWKQEPFVETYCSHGWQVIIILSLSFFLSDFLSQLDPVCLLIPLLSLFTSFTPYSFTSLSLSCSPSHFPCIFLSLWSGTSTCGTTAGWRDLTCPLVWVAGRRWTPPHRRPVRAPSVAARPLSMPFVLGRCISSMTHLSSLPRWDPLE